MKIPHKHAEFIKAWADGAEIQFYLAFSKTWADLINPSWLADEEYRIKPEPKPDSVVIAWVFNDKIAIPVVDGNVKFTFCGKTGHLKAAEVL